ncbi:MAG: LexA family protein [Bacillota bacterium]
MNETSFNLLKFAERLKELMADSNENTYTLAEAVFMSPGTISKYANGKMEPSRKAIELLAKYFRVNPVWLMGYEVDKWLDGQAPKVKNIPFFKRAYLKSEVKVDSYVPVSVDEDVDICVMVNDNSMMNARIFEGDLAYIRKQSMVEHGEIAAVFIDDKMTLKRIYLSDNSMTLHSENPTIPDIILSKKERKEIAILGKVVYVKFEVR